MIETKNYVLNKYRTKKIRKKYLITTDHGSWVCLDEKDYCLLRLNSIEKSKELFNLLEENGVILTEENKDKIVSYFKEKNKFLFQGTSLHIIIPTLRCDMKCIYCHASSKSINAKDYDMKKEIAKKTVDFIFQSTSDKITIEFQGGEPLLRFDLVKCIIEYSKKLNDKYRKDLHNFP